MHLLCGGFVPGTYRQVVYQVLYWYDILSTSTVLNEYTGSTRYRLVPTRGLTVLVPVYTVALTVALTVWESGSIPLIQVSYRTGTVSLWRTVLVEGTVLVLQVVSTRRPVGAYTETV